MEPQRADAGSSVDRATGQPGGGGLDQQDASRTRTPLSLERIVGEAIELIAGRAKTEASGNVDASNIRALADLGVDYVSSGALTHSAPILDLSLKHLRMLDAEAAR